MADKKLTYQMVSPGEAWNNFVNSKDGHNAAAVTPSYLDNTKSQQPEKNTGSIEKNSAPDFSSGNTPSQNSITKENPQQPAQGSIGTSTPTDRPQKNNIPNFFSGYPKNENSVAQDKSKNPDKGIEMER